MMITREQSGRKRGAAPDASPAARAKLARVAAGTDVGEGRLTRHKMREAALDDEEPANAAQDGEDQERDAARRMALPDQPAQGVLTQPAPALVAQAPADANRIICDLTRYIVFCQGTMETPIKQADAFRHVTELHKQFGNARGFKAFAWYQACVRARAVFGLDVVELGASKSFVVVNAYDRPVAKSLVDVPATEEAAMGLLTLILAQIAISQDKELPEALLIEVVGRFLTEDNEVADGEAGAMWERVWKEKNHELGAKPHELVKSLVARAFLKEETAARAAAAAAEAPAQHVYSMGPRVAAMLGCESEAEAHLCLLQRVIKPSVDQRADLDRAVELAQAKVDEARTARAEAHAAEAPPALAKVVRGVRRA